MRTPDADPAADGPDAVTGQVLAFATAVGLDAHGCLDRAAGVPSLPAVWSALRDAGIEAPGLAFAAWSATGGLSGPLLPILANCPDVGALLERLERFHPLFGEAEVVLTRRGDGASLALRGPDGEDVDPATVDACFALLHRAVDQLTGGASHPDRVRLRRRRPADPAPYLSALGDVRFGSSGDACEFDAATLSTPLVRADPAILSLLEPYAEQLVARRGASWSTRVVAALEPALDRPPALADVAHQLAVSPRALQVRLREEGTSYRALLDDLQRRRALALLRTTALPVTEVAARTGFSSPAAFTRAVRRWTGTTPRAVRGGR